MNRLFSVLLFLIFSTLMISCQQIEQERKPNVILIITDDQGYGDLGIHQNSGKTSLTQSPQKLQLTASNIPELGLGDIYSIRLRPVGAGHK